MRGRRAVAPEARRAAYGARPRRSRPLPALVVGLTVIAAVLAATPDARAALSLTTTAAPTFAATLNGTDQAPTYTLPMSASDTTGTGAGWHLSVTSTQLSTGGATPHLLPTGASSITDATATCAAAPCTNPANSIAFPVAVPAGATPPPAVSFFDAQTNSGMGAFTVTATVAVNIAANTYAGSYTSTLTLSIASGP